MEVRMTELQVRGFRYNYFGRVKKTAVIRRPDTSSSEAINSLVVSLV
jgi:hypothetical protein